MDLLGISFELLKAVAGLAVIVLGPFLTKKIRDRDLREKIATVADAALVLAIHAARNRTLSDLGELLREVVQNILNDPTVPKQLRDNEKLAMQAAAAAVARAGLAGVQAVQVNADGTATPVTRLPRP